MARKMTDQIWDDFRVSLEDQGKSPAEVDKALEDAAPFRSFEDQWLDRNMGPDQIVMSRERVQYLLTNRAEGSELPDSFAVHAIGKPIRHDMPYSDAVNVIKD